jgi:hypothetical protein
MGLAAGEGNPRQGAWGLKILVGAVRVRLSRLVLVVRSGWTNWVYAEPRAMLSIGVI